VVEIDWLDESAAALEKVARYFDPGFLGPNGSFVKEVWCVFMSRAKPPLPAELVENGPAAPLHAFTGVPPLPAGAAEQTVIVYHSRGNAAFPPCMALVEWNTTISVPAGSLCAGGGFDANGALRRMYRGRNDCPRVLSFCADTAVLTLFLLYICLLPVLWQCEGIRIPLHRVPNTVRVSVLDDKCARCIASLLEQKFVSRDRFRKRRDC
jgi:hypothetical protein